ncbi:MAG: amidase, partial [Candidatus Berkelbacteria bacterium]
MTDLNKLNLKESIEKLKNGEITSAELTEACFSEIEKSDKDINAFISTMKEEAMKMAQASDERRKNGQILSEIDGVPIAIKDNMCMEGTKTTAASKILENFVAPYDATVVVKLKNAGAVIIGKTNLDEFAMGSSTENSYFGVTKNPHDLERVSGGSSGGSAAAVASDMCIAALG